MKLVPISLLEGTVNKTEQILLDNLFHTILLLKLHLRKEYASIRTYTSQTVVLHSPPGINQIHIEWGKTLKS